MSNYKTARRIDADDITRREREEQTAWFDFFCADGEKATEEGDTCPKCNAGKLKYGPVDNCTCHIFPPCSACVDNPLVCDSCGEEFGP